jgi:hypothetical protein
MIRLLFRRLVVSSSRRLIIIFSSFYRFASCQRAPYSIATRGGATLIAIARAKRDSILIEALAGVGELSISMLIREEVVMSGMYKLVYSS